MLRLSRNLLWVILSLYDTFHAEIYYSKVSFTLNQLSFVLPAVVLSCSFRDRKEPKGPGTREFQSTSFWFKSRKRHLSVKEVLPLKLSGLFLGAVELLQLATPCRVSN